MVVFVLGVDDDEDTVGGGRLGGRDAEEGAEGFAGLRGHFFLGEWNVM